MPPRQAPAPKPKRFRVLWEDNGGSGHFADVDAGSESEAVWTVALGNESGTFAGAYPIPAKADD